MVFTAWDREILQLVSIICFNMGPKTNSGASKKVEQKKKEKIIEVGPEFPYEIALKYKGCVRLLMLFRSCFTVT